MLDARHGTQRPILFSSPLARVAETAQPWLRWQCEVAIEERVAEIPSPTDDLAERACGYNAPCKVAGRSWHRPHKTGGKP